MLAGFANSQGHGLRRIVINLYDQAQACGADLAVGHRELAAPVGGDVLAVRLLRARDLLAQLQAAIRGAGLPYQVEWGTAGQTRVRSGDQACDVPHRCWVGRYG
ncbi:MAG: hypothetical protein ACFB51_11005, partial [Anaerolineae bacterium]